MEMPFANYRSVFHQQNAWICTHDSFQGNAIRIKNLYKQLVFFTENFGILCGIGSEQNRADVKVLGEVE